MHPYTNLDYAIAAVKERGHAVTVPNVLAAYIHCIAARVPAEDAKDDDALAQAAILSFERAMDKYPAPAPAPLPKTKNVAAQIVAPVDTSEAVESGLGHRLFCEEVARLRGEYLRALWRASDVGPGYEGCKCRSCGCLLKVRADQVRKLVSEDEEEGPVREVARPVRKRRTRKTATKKKARSVKSVPFDPYAPSTSRAAI